MKDLEKISKDLKEIAKGSRKKALAIAVAAAFAVSGPLGFAGCYNPTEDEDDQDDNNAQGGYVGGWHAFSGGSSGADSSVNDGSSSGSKSSITDSAGGGKASGYSGAKGGSSSS